MPNQTQQETLEALKFERCRLRREGRNLDGTLGCAHRCLPLDAMPAQWIGFASGSGAVCDATAFRISAGSRLSTTAAAPSAS
jgi:hypothetical protein